MGSGEDDMKRTLVLGVLVTVGALSITAAAQRGGRGGRGADAAPMVVEVQKVKDNVFVLTGGGGNTAAFVTSTGVVLVDTKNPGWGQPLLTALRTVTDRPVTTVINTHTHGDHVSGQLEFTGTIEYVSHANTKAHMEQQDAFKQTPRALPTRTFTDRLTVGSGDDRIDLYYFGRAHTDGDAWVAFPAAGVLHSGDAFAGKQVPLVDANNGGSGVAYPATRMKVYSGVTGIDTIITGHSTTMAWADLKQYADFNADFLAWVREQMKAGTPPEQAAREYTVPARFPGYTADLPPFFGGMEGYLKSMYSELGAR
jgi:glyoxylase-like metal-dependent hydrolase (beta-lactamase superfamily II)